MMIIIILTASYIGDDVRIVYSLVNTMRSFSVTDGRTDKGILEVGLPALPLTSVAKVAIRRCLSDMLLPECQFPPEEDPGHLHLATVQTPVESNFDFYQSKILRSILTILTCT